jgi:hypothetical protein
MMGYAVIGAVMGLGCRIDAKGISRSLSLIIQYA